MIKAVIFDFDGVILESMDIKTEAFREIFKTYPDKVDEIVRYHLKNGGISRFVKFRHIYENILGLPYDKSDEERLGKIFSETVFSKVMISPFVPGALEFLQSNKGRYMLFVASGTPDDELTRILAGRDLKKYFTGAKGSPATKQEIIRVFMERYRLSADEAVFVGDAESDRAAASDTGLAFIERKSGQGISGESTGTVLADLKGLGEAIVTLNGVIRK